MYSLCSYLITITVEYLNNKCGISTQSNYQASSPFFCHYE